MWREGMGREPAPREHSLLTAWSLAFGQLVSVRPMDAETDAIEIPESLRWLAGDEQGRAWLDRLPTLVKEACALWRLVPGTPFRDGYCSLALPVQLEAGSAAVLKVQFPDRESEHEAEALTAWNGNGAVHLLDHSPELHALLLERCLPGTYLSELDHDAAIEVFVDLLPRLAVSVDGPFTTLRDEAEHWIVQLEERWSRAGRPFERALVDRALDVLRTQSQDQGPQVLLHQDLHPDNVLRSEREPWLVIDPKPLVGEMEFAVAPIVRAGEIGRSRELTRRRLDILSTELDLDRERSINWTFAQTMAWSFENHTPIPEALETARWLIDL